jgi:pyruvate ferredoxin oxidoreductase alpha subunit
MDGFILTHAYERVDLPTQAQVDAYLPPYEPRQVLDPAEPVSIGAMVGPEAFMEVRYLAHAKQQQALQLIPAWADEFRRVFGRPSGGLVHSYRTSDADVVVVALGSVLGTIKDTVDEMREQGHRIGVLGITCFRPWPSAAVRAALANAKRVVVLEKSLAVGMGGIVANNVSASFAGPPDRVHTVIAGLGGRSITRASLRGVFEQALADSLEPVRFLDLDHALVDRVLERERTQRRSGPIAEGILRDIGVVAAKAG